MGYEKAVDALYETVFQPERWRDTAAECATLVYGTTFFLQVADPLTRHVEVVAGHGLESLGLAAYEPTITRSIIREPACCAPQKTVSIFIRGSSIRPSSSAAKYLPTG